MAYAKAADAAVAYLTERVLNDEWVAKHDDVAYYFKAPMTFLESGSTQLAERALDVAARFAERGGLESSNAVYASQYPHYPWMWICWAATRLKREDLAHNCYTSLYAYVRPTTCAGLVKAPYSEDTPYEADLFATAEVVKAALLAGRQEVAEAAADKLVEVLEANRGHMEKGRFYLRWTGQEFHPHGDQGFGTASEALVIEEDAFHCIRSETPGQLYFMLAFPVMVLLELASVLVAERPPASEAYRAGATSLLGYLKGCKGVFESPMAHKVGIAAAMAKDTATATRIADFLVSLQQPAGCFQEDPEAMDCVDQTAEIACWLYQIQRELQ